jgi:DNA-binding GntR family transcriptional regulator
MRGALETLALRLAVPKMTEKDFWAAEQVIVRYQQEMEISSWGGLNWDFHSALYRAAERPMLLNSIQTLHNNTDRYFNLDPLLMEYWPKIKQEHRQILEACRAREVKAAVRQLSEHITYASRQLVTYLERGT